VVSTTSADVSIHGEKSATIDCNKDPNVSIQSGDGAFTLTGSCSKISVNGGQNKLTIESVKKLSINGAGNVVDVGTAEKIGIVGNDNVVTWKAGPAKGKKPTVGTVGTNNKVTQK
jgi:hypothetical protein